MDLFTLKNDSDESILNGDWPNPSRFPTNSGSYRVEHQVIQDLRASTEASIITGFASLDRIIDFAVSLGGTKVKLLVGSEPTPSQRESFKIINHDFPTEIEKFWLKKGISLLYSGKIIRCIELLESGQIEARFKRNLHAKIYRGDNAITMGSSNFTNAGLTSQIEGNTRFESPTKRFKENCLIVETLWSSGKDYSKQLINLLRKLLQVVTWQEALARACSELLEGEWAAHYLDRDNLSGAETLWGHQRSGIAQALFVLDKQGSVLVADATGSGKTRMGAHLIGAVSDRIVRTNRMRHGKAILLSPANVVDSWKNEAIKSSTSADIYSQGELSHGKELPIEALRRAQVLCVDEGHNFLSLSSNRTRHVLRNMADHVLMFTATPINKSISDIVSIINVLGPDNLDDKTLNIFRKLVARKSYDYSVEETALLKKTIEQFTVRRTKNELNYLVDKEPDRYKDSDGKVNRYPIHIPKIYSLNEPDADRDLAREIVELASKLKAVTYFQKPLVLPANYQYSEESYLASRIKSASALARYNIMSALRSSRAALHQHIQGTNQAVESHNLQGYDVGSFKEPVFQVLDKIAGHPPKNSLRIDVPDWLSDQDKHASACFEDKKIYYQIAQLVSRMSDAREREKARTVIEVLESHDLVLAFDHRPISLSVIGRLIREMSDYKVLISSGTNLSGKKDIIDKFALGSAHTGIAGLTSDALSESVNLQQASAVINLDLPSVIRMIEQRVGRVDRMNSPHERIEVYWPSDSEEFALSSDQLLVERHETVESLLGSNMPLPDKLSGVKELIRTEALIEEFENKPDIGEWDGITDAFKSVRELIIGEDKIVGSEVYDKYKHITDRVLSRVSVVRTKKPWAFFCLTAGPHSTPRWVFLSSLNKKPILELDAIASALRAHLTPDVESIMSLDRKATEKLNYFLGRLKVLDRELLPRKNQRALNEMQKVLLQWQKKMSEEKNQEVLDIYTNIINLLVSEDSDKQPDWEFISTSWLDLIRPIWHQYLPEAKQTIPMLKDIRSRIIQEEESLRPLIKETFNGIVPQAGLDERVKACIIGVK